MKPTRTALRLACGAAVAYLVGRAAAYALVARALRTDTLADLGGDD